MNKNRIYKIFKYVTLLIIFTCTQQLFPQADFTIIGLPDTQWYSENAVNGTGFGSGDIATFIAQTQWIVDNRADLNIVYVAHVGDCVQNGDTGNSFLPGTTPTNDDEWVRATTAMYLLENPATTGLSDGIPYGIAVGNHDQSNWGNPDGTTTLYNTYFGYEHFKNKGYYGDPYESSNNDNHYDLFSASGLDFIVIYIEYGAYSDPDVLSWADNLLSTTYSNRKAIVVSHKLLNGNTESDPIQFHDPFGTTIFNALKSNPNLFLMLCGHYTDDRRRMDDVGGGHIIHSLLSDYQSKSNGGDGWMRIMTFHPSTNTISVQTFSPTRNGGLGDYKIDSNSEFTLNNIPLPVELAFFTGALNGNDIELRWRTETEVNNYGFDIESTKENSDWLTIGFVEGHGNSNSPKQYNFIDSDINQSGTYFYRLKQIDNDGTYEYSDVVSVEVGIPSNFYLSQNYPNPFNPETRFDFTLPEKQLITLRIYNTLGEIVVELVNEEREAGSYSVTFNASNLPSGVYIYRLQTQSFAENKKMTLLK